MNIEELRSWIGRREVRRDVITAAPLSAMAATLDHEAHPFKLLDEVPLPWHWTFFLASTPQSQLGKDGHPLKGGFMPPISLPRRMWAGSQITSLKPLRVGDAVRRESTIKDISSKEGRSGPLVFLTLSHEIFTSEGKAIIEIQDIVYRDRPVQVERKSEPKLAPSNALWKRRIDPSAPLLFRYSALTFNSHRIHYDRPYAENEEGYPGLVVQGPLIATCLVDLLLRELPSALIREFSFRSVRPLTDRSEFFVCGKHLDDGNVHLWAQDSDGYLAANAIVRLS